MRANLKDKEQGFINFWKDHAIYKKINAKKSSKTFVLHVGPPYANGAIHIGHALTETLKDLVVKNYRLLGYHAPLVFGWDCHGLPIEIKVEEAFRKQDVDKDQIEPLDFIGKCREFAKRWIDVQKDGFERLGIFFDERIYSTMDKKSEATVARSLSTLLMQGYIYRGKKPILWSVVEKTALAEAEVEYKEHTSDAIYVRFPIVKGKYEGASAIIWTTTPWSLPANRAIAYNPEIEYGLYESSIGRVIVAIKLASSIPHFDGTLVESFKGTCLDGHIAHHPFHDKGYEFDVPFLPADHVLDDSGTGLVHTAPTHGLEDFELGKKYKLEVPDTVLGNGIYAPWVPLFAGMHVYKVNPKIIEELKNVSALVHHETIKHSYPHSWRSKKPLIYRCTQQWFLKIDLVRDKLISEIERVKWIPESGKKRILSMVEKRPDWCLSRQRIWGVPLPIIIDTRTGEHLKDPVIQERIIKTIEEGGIEAWYRVPVSDFLDDRYAPFHYYEKIYDTADVWFDSASTYDFVLKSGDFDLTYPADLYLEGSDQHRGWFQSSLIHSCALHGRAPYNEVVTHGFILDEKGQKMSKSQGNGMDPLDFPADIIRLWVALSNYREDVRFGKGILSHVEDVYRRVRNTLRYLLGILHGYQPLALTLPNIGELNVFERYILARLYDLSRKHKEMMDDYSFYEFYQELHAFCNNDLSAFYFDIRKDTIYCDDQKNELRIQTQHVMHQVLLHLLSLWSAVLTFTCEEAFHVYRTEINTSLDCESICLMDYACPLEWKDDCLLAQFDALFKVRRLVTSALEKEREQKTIASSLEADVIVRTPLLTEELKSLMAKDWDVFFITSHAVVSHHSNESVSIKKASGTKCPRCWRYQMTYDNALCSRCESVTLSV